MSKDCPNAPGKPCERVKRPVYDFNTGVFKGWEYKCQRCGW